MIVSLGAKLKVEKCKLVRDWFVANEFADFGDAISNLFLSRMLPAGFVEDKAIQEKVVKYFGSFDENIKGFHVEEVPPEGESKGLHIRLMLCIIRSDQMRRLKFL